MSLGPATLLALAAALLATAVWAFVKDRWPIVAMFLFGVLLALVILAGPLVRLP